MGIYDGVGALTAQQKVLAAQAEILAQTGDAQGDFARTSDGLANQQRILAAEMQNTKDAIGSAVLPAMQAVVGVAGDVFGAFNALPDGTKNAIGGMAGFGVAALAVAGVTSTVIGQLIKMRSNFAAIGTTGKIAAGGLGLVSLAAFAVAKGAQQATDRTNELTQATQELTTASEKQVLETLLSAFSKAILDGKDLGEVLDNMAYQNLPGFKRAIDVAAASGEVNNEMLAAMREAVVAAEAKVALGADTLERYGDTAGDAATVLDGDTTPAVDSLTDSTELTRRAAEKLDRQWDELKGEISDERAFLDMEQTFVDLRTAAEEA
jgi:hypothetical protein